MSRRLRLAVFDLDGVLVEEPSSWGYLHRVFGTYEHALRANYAKAFEDGLITYSEWMRLDLELMIRERGTIYCRDIEEAFDRVRIVEGARDVVSYLKERGVGTAIVSAGIESLATKVARALDIDEVYANRLLCDSEGRLVPQGVEVVNPLRKGELVEGIAKRRGVDLSETMYVGDSEWDCSALKIVGFPVVMSSTSIECGDSHVPLIRVSGMLELALLIRKL